jgi:hypothetical protein
MRDSLFRPSPTTLDQVPPSAARLTDAWLTAALCPAGDVRVTGHRVEPISSGSTERSRLFLRYSDPTAGLPSSMFVKSTSSFLTRRQVGATGGMGGEVRFYQRVLPGTDIVAPQGFYGRAHRPSGRSVLLLEDLAPQRVRFGDATRPLDRAAAEAVVDALAVVHGTFEDSPRFDTDLSWVLTSRRLQDGLNTFVDSQGRSEAGFDLAADRVLPAELRPRRVDVHRYRMAAIALDDHRPVGLVHHDVHAGNWYLTPDGRAGLFDWSAYARGQGTRDVAYALMSALTVDDRRAWERDLLDRYADRLSVVTGSPHDSAATFLSYRQQTLHGFCFWLATLGSGRWQPKMQTDETSLVNIERMAQAVVDLDTFRAIDSATGERA